MTNSSFSKAAPLEGSARIEYLTIIKILWKLTAFYGFNALLYYGLLAFYFRPTIKAVLIYSSLGILLWTFLEYAIHRFFLHPPQVVIQNKYVKSFLHYCHLKHHDDSLDPHLFHIPLPVTLIVYFPVVLLVYLVFWRLDYTLLIISSTMLGYVFFEWFHLWVHMTQSRAPWARWYRKYHFVHHYKNPNKCFGVTTPLWDLIFRTW